MQSTSRAPDPASLTEAPHPLRRSPLAPIDQQALASTPDHMSSPSSPHPSSVVNQDPNSNINPQRYIGKPILSRRSSHTSEEAYASSGQQCAGQRKKSQ
ncbi:hypothetical protein DENSPDRAFT_132902 [Dentipellis sp. KUC8613]|nr:hypothetical protein DENSPDRAFT_132902 [Dentipellis sp. KUC8613]